jgi:hypothetical protein
VNASTRKFRHNPGAVRVELLAEPVKVYNFQVADWHTYYAAPEADKPFVWVHPTPDRIVGPTLHTKPAQSRQSAQRAHG